MANSEIEEVVEVRFTLLHLIFVTGNICLTTLLINARWPGFRWHEVCSVEFSADDMFVVAGSVHGRTVTHGGRYQLRDFEQTVHIYEVRGVKRTALPLQTFSRQRRTAVNTVPFEFCRFRRDSNDITVGTLDGRIVLIQDNGNQTRTLATGLASPILSLATSTDAVAVSISSGQVALFDLTNGKHLFAFWAQDRPRHMSFGADGRDLYVGCDRGVTVWDLSRQTEAATFALPDKLESMTVSPSGKLLAAATRDSVQVIEIETGQSCQLNQQGVVDMAFSPDTTLLAMVCESAVVICSLETLESTDLQQIDTQPSSVEFSHDGTALAVGGFAGKVGIWDVKSREVCWKADLPKMRTDSPCVGLLGLLMWNLCWLTIAMRKRRRVRQTQQFWRDSK